MVAPGRLKTEFGKLSLFKMNTNTKPSAHEQKTGASQENAYVALKSLLTRSISFHPILARISGSATAGLFLSQAFYWSNKGSDPEGWFYKTCEEWQEETTLSRYEQDGARKVLKKHGFLSDALRCVAGTNRPILHFRVHLDRVFEAVVTFGENQQMHLRETSKRNKEAEITTESTSEITTGGKGSLRSPTEKRPSLSQSERDTMDWKRIAPWFTDKLAPQPGTYIPDRNRELIERARSSAMYGGVSVVRAQELFRQFYPGQAWVEDITRQLPLIAEGQDEPEAETEESPEVAQRRLESGRRAGVVWEYVRDYVKARISPHSFDTWIKPLRAVSLDGGVLTVHMPHAEFKQVADKFGDHIEKAIAGRAEDVKFVMNVEEQRATA